MPNMLERNNWFNRNPKKTWFILFIVIFSSFEIILRVVDPVMLKSIYMIRQPYRYTDNGYRDLKSNVHIHAFFNKPFTNFLLTSNKYGFRDYDRPFDYYPSGSIDSLINNKDKIIVHAIGDSMTMGWGISYNCSYPAILDSLLDKKYRVLNLGVDGFGAIAATEKSMALWKKFPAKYAIYLFCYNDFDDDQNVSKMRERLSLFNYLYKLQFTLRNFSYSAALPYAIMYYVKFKNFTDDINSDSSFNGFKYNELKDLIINDTVDIDYHDFENLLKNNNKYQNTISAINSYKKFVDDNGGKVVVLAKDCFESRILYFLCQKQNIKVTLFTFPLTQSILRNDDHFSQVGNYILAKYIASEINKITKTGEVKKDEH